MVTEQEEISIGYLLDPAFQLVNSNGKPLTDGWIECYIHGTRNKYYCYSDWNGNLHPFRIPIDSIGSNVVLADPNRAYDVYVYNKYGTLVMSRYNVSPGHASGASVGGSGDAGHWIARLGSTTTAPKNQYSNSIPIPANPDYEGNFVDRINGNNIYLKEGLYLVDAILRFRQNPDDLSNTFGDIHVFTGVDDAETVVYNRNETGPDADETDYHQIRVQFVRHVTGNTDDVVCFQVKSTNALSWIQIQNLSIVKLGGGYGVAPQPIEYSAGQYISIDNDTISVTGLQPSGNYATVESVYQGFYGVAQQINTLSGAIDDVAGSIPSIEGLASEQYVDEHIEEAVSGKADRSEIPSLDGYATQEYVQSQVSGKADKSEIPSLDGYATETYVQSAVSGKQDELEFTYDSDNKITSIDGHGIAGTGGGGGGGSSYIPGQYISIQNDVISVTGLQPSGDYQPAGDYLTQDDLNGYATTEEVEDAVSGKADKSEIPSVAGLASEQYVDEHIEEATSGKADVSAIPSLNGYATESWVNEQGFLKEVPQEFVTDSELNSAISGKADKSEIPSVDGLASETYVDEHIQSATSGKADKSEIPSLAGYATQDWVNQQGFVDDDALEEATSGKMDSSAYTAPVNADWSATSGLSQILNKPEQSQLIPGEGIEITPSGADYIISSTGGGSTYTEGDYVSIQNDVISVTGLQPSGEYLVPQDLNGYATTEDVEEATSGKLDSSAYTAPVNADWNATSGLSQILNKPNIQEYAAGDGIAINSGTISVNIGKNLAFESPKEWFELDAPGSQTGSSSYGLSLLGQLNATMIAALKNGQVNYKPNFNFTTSYSSLDHHFAICKKSAYNQPDYNNCLGSTQTITLDGSTVLKADENYVIDFSSVDASSTTTWAAIEADPTSYYLAAICWYSNQGISSWISQASANGAVPSFGAIGHPGQIEVSDPTAPKVLYAVDQAGGGGGTVSGIPLSAGPGVKLQLVDDHVEASLDLSGYIWTSASLFHTDNPVTKTTYTLSDTCQNYDKLEVDFYDINGWRTQMDCPIPPGLANSGTRGGYFSVVTNTSATNSPIWFKAFNWSAYQTTWRCYCSELAGTGGSSTVGVNANQPDNPPKVMNIVGWKRRPIQ